MASVAHLGQHSPAGLPYLKQERLIGADNPSTDSYEWSTQYTNYDDLAEDEELIETQDAVAWSKGGVVRKVFRFKVEQERLQQAVLTNFMGTTGTLIRKGDGGSSSKTTQNGSHSKNTKEDAEVESADSRREIYRRTRALVVFLQTQAHVFYLSGSNVVIHLPFEVERAFATPCGLIIQKKLPTPPPSTSTSTKVPKPARNMSGPGSMPFSGTSSMQSTFSVEGLNSPAQLHIPPPALFGTGLPLCRASNSSNGPRFFSMTDPMADFGLVVTGTKTSSTHRRTSFKATLLDSQEEIVHISSPLNNVISTTIDEKLEQLILAITMNRTTMAYTVWKVKYIDQIETAVGMAKGKSKDDKQRRRSSFMPAAAASSVGSPPSLRQSLGGAENIQGQMKKKARKTGQEQRVDFATSLDPDVDVNGMTPRRKSRRVSSMLVRADLSMSQTYEQAPFTNLNASQNGLGRSKSIGGANSRSSFGGNRKSFRNSIAANSFTNSINSFLDTPVDDLLEDLKNGGDFEGFQDIGLEDDNLEGLPKEIVFTKIESVSALPQQPQDESAEKNFHYRVDKRPADLQCNVFTMVMAPEVAEKTRALVCIHDTSDKFLIVIDLALSWAKKTPSMSFQRKEKLGEPVKVTFKVNPKETVRADHVIDACELRDGDVTRLLVLSETVNQKGDLTLQVPWGLMINVPVPPLGKKSKLRPFGSDYITQYPRMREGRDIFMTALRNPLPRGVVDLRDPEMYLQQVQIKMQPKNILVKRAIDACRYVLAGKMGDIVLVGWWNAYQWLVTRSRKQNEAEMEFTAFVITLFGYVLTFARGDVPMQQIIYPMKHKKSKSRTLVSNPVAAAAKLRGMLAGEAAFEDASAPWRNAGGWDWMTTEGSDLGPNEIYMSDDPLIIDSLQLKERASAVQIHTSLAVEFMDSPYGHKSSTTSVQVPDVLGEESPDSLQFVLRQIMKTLHLVYEDAKLDITLADSLTSGTQNLAPALLQMSKWLGWKNWASYYETQDVEMQLIDYSSRRLVPVEEPTTIPNVVEWVHACFTTTPLPYLPTLTDLKYDREDNINIEIEKKCLALTPLTCKFKSFFSKIDGSIIQCKSSSIVEALSSVGFTSMILDTLPETVLIPFKEAITACQNEPEAKWGKKLLTFVGREDVNMLLFQDGKNITTIPVLAPTHEAKNEVDVICGSISEPEAVGSVDTSSESSRLEITRLIFKEDQRYSEAGRLISTNKPLPCKLELEPGWTESEELTAQKEYTQQMATRTLAFPPGRGLLYYNARVPLLTEKFPIPGFNLHCYFKNTQTTVGVEKQHFTEDKVNWAFFHAGVSAGLSISREAKGIDTSWIMYNKPSELSNRHGGFILALGLQGHLTDVAKWVAFKYLTMKHQMTTIGLLLGMAASRIGSMDTQVTKVLSIHVVRMQPPGSAELNLAPLIQTTALMGVGLNYCGSQHRRMSELMLSEIESMDLDEENQVLRDEGYRLSAGFALGFINLAKGNELGGMHDLHLAERLLKLAIGSKKVDAVHILDKCTAGAMVALALTFMKTENASLAKKLEIPKSRLQFGYTRPDIFLLRTLARNLIMWSEIEASQSWINKNIPDDYRDKADLRRVHELTTQDLAFYNILAGLLFSIALKYAGTGNVLIRHLLVGYLDQFMRLAELPANNFDEQLARATIRRHQDLLALCCATLMAGTGDLEVFRRLRILHGNRSSDVTFGSHMAASTAIGALFLGGGTHTFSTKPLAVGALIVAFYPIYPSTILDNKCHLQAFRHFWVLASEMRCIVTRDVDTNLPVHIPLQISLIKEKQNVQSKMASKYTPLMSLTSPCLLPAIEMIASITTGSREYWAVHLDFINEPAHRSAFEKTWTVYVKRRPAYAASDPWGSGTFRSTMWAIGDVDKTHKKKEVFEWLWQFDAFKKFTEVERELVLPTGGRMIQKGLGTTLVDTRLVLQNCTVDAGKRDRLEGAKGLFEWAQGMAENKNEPRWVRREAVLDVKAALGEKEVESDEKENGGWIEKADVDEEDDEYGYERKEGVERVVQEGEEENEYWEGDYGVQ